MNSHIQPMNSIFRNPRSIHPLCVTVHTPFRYHSLFFSSKKIVFISLAGNEQTYIRMKKSFHPACQDIGTTRKFVVYNGSEQFPMADTQRQLACLPFWHY